MRIATWLASGLGSGYAPVAPGTFGTVFGLALGAALLAWSPWAVLGAAVAASVAGVWAIEASGARDDPGWVVIDEIAGILIAILPLSRPSLVGMAIAFALFRLLDIAKPGPIGWIDRRSGPVAVMGDDILAGAISALLLWGMTIMMPKWIS
jgi:phosphatidylglycerophosphatase A